MVKGNWERRVEIVAARRAEEKANKANKAAGSKQFATGESVVTKLLRDPLIQQREYRVEGWVEVEGASQACQSWLRLEKCPQKKCKLLHHTNISHLGSLQCPNEDKTTESICDGPLNIQSIARKDYSKLRFIAVDGICVYDHLYPNVWSDWWELRTEAIKSLDTSKLASIPETIDKNCDDELESIVKNNESLEDTIAMNLQQATLTSVGLTEFFLKPENQAITPFYTIVSHIILFLSPNEAGRLALTNKTLYHQCLKTEIYRLRKREGHAAFIAHHSKEKKMEKKKKVKQANTKKDSKKDGFARGGNSH